LAAFVTLIHSEPVRAQLLLRDDFDGTGNVNTTVWRLPFGTEGTFVGRTQFRGNPAVDMPQEGIAEPLASDGKVTEIKLDTYSPIDPGNQFLGTDLLTKRNFARAGGLTFEARMRLKPTTVGGLVDGFFLFDVTRENPPGTLVRDEIDFELLSNQATGGGATHDPFTNYWNDEPFSDPGDGQFVNVGGLDLTQFQNYKVEWTPQHMKWYVNNQLVRTQTSNVPNDPMKLHFNLWAPDSTFADAFNAALQPAATPGANQTYSVQVDHVEVNRINTTSSANLLYDPSFEIESGPTFIGNVPATTTGEWLGFGGPPTGLHVTYEIDDISGADPGVPDMAHEGVFMAKAFGPFNGPPDASGIVQNVPAAPGEQFEARAWMQTADGDSIQGTNNFNTIQLAFMNSSGAVIESAPFVPVNGKDFPVLDGRDPNIVEDTWLEGVVNAIAPAGTAFVRVSLFFIQLNNQGGATWFDDVSLVRLTPNVVSLPGDFNNDGKVDAADYVVWRKNETANNPLPNDNGLTTQAARFSLWKSSFGNMAGSGASSGAVPEPSAFVLAMFASAVAAGCRLGRRHR
jgi:beta-glucanase (GH16 family)